ncbi:hypothetical protein JAAARDRAFT_316005 [Jaapia argillacea MUCL 33604]|uniref:Uncharacterized protein n=1 Tax=Jaapia argillacea MUCL 33604 TaxID=933084 RepID=A0A067PMD9_9AGAM|nr:hypothetical protein JAAARDRAFT_316005 [Jaapia argillacea MUCL 33604]
MLILSLVVPALGSDVYPVQQHKITCSYCVHGFLSQGYLQNIPFCPTSSSARLFPGPHSYSHPSEVHSHRLDERSQHAEANALMKLLSNTSINSLSP